MSDITNEGLIRFCAPRLIEEFGKNTFLDKHQLPPDVAARCHKHDGERPVWSILTHGKQAFDYKVHGAGKSPVSALKAAGMGGIVEDYKNSLKYDNRKPNKKNS